MPKFKATGCSASLLFDELMGRISAGELRAQSGDAFLRSVVEEVTKAIGADIGFISLLKKRGCYARTSTLFSQDNNLVSLKYEINGTPCEQVITRREPYLCSKNVRSNFPNDRDLVDLRVEAYAGAPLIAYDGRMLGLFSFLFRDKINDPAQVERLLRLFAPLVAAQTERIEASDRMHLALEGSGNGIWEWDLESGSVFYDDFCRTMLGYTREELPDDFDSWIAIVHPDEREEALQELRRHVKTSRPFDFKCRMRQNGGYYRWYRARATSVRSEDGRATRMLGTITDIDDLESATQRALAASAAKSAFLANMSHELRTPMNAVMGMLQLLRTSDINETQEEWIDISYRSANALLVILNDILDLSRLEAGKLDIEIKNVRARELVNDLGRTYAALAKEKGLAFTLDVRDDAPEFVRADANRLRQILTNFLGNALKFTEAGSIGVRLCRSPVGQARIEVHDTGPGVSDEVAQRLFNRFEMGDTSVTRKFGGTGLGLAICRELASRMDAEVGVVSAPGEGSTFWVELPAAAARHAA